MTPHLLSELSDLFLCEAEAANDRGDYSESDRLSEIAEELHVRSENIQA